MISQSNNRVQAIKSKFESLNSEKDQLIPKTSKPKYSLGKAHLCKQNSSVSSLNTTSNLENDCTYAEKENRVDFPSKTSCLQSERGNNTFKFESNDSKTASPPKPNSSYLYAKLETQKSNCDSKKLSLSRQSSDPGKKLHRSHAFRCDKSQKLSSSPKRHGSCHGRSETSDYTLKTSEKPKLSKDRLKRLGNLLEDKMKKENFVSSQKSELHPEISTESVTMPFNSIPDNEVPKHILDQYAKVVKPKKEADSQEEYKQDPMTDSGVSSETENLEDVTEKGSRLKQLKAQFETGVKTEPLTKYGEKGIADLDLIPKLKSNLELMNSVELSASSETMRLERKNPHVDLTDTLKKALKQPLPIGPPPKKPPRTFIQSPVPFSVKNDTQKRKDAKQMLEKLEQVLQKREEKNNSPKNVYDIAETNLSLTKPKGKEIHYLCTEILGITNRTLLPNNQNNLTDGLSNCFKSLDCSIINNKSTTSLPYSRLSTGSIPNRNSLGNICCSCSSESLDRIEDKRGKFSTFFAMKPDENLCKKCIDNTNKTHRFQCHINCNCKERKSEFFVPKFEHIYDVPNIEEKIDTDSNKSSEKNDIMSGNSEGNNTFCNSVVKSLSKSIDNSDIVYGSVNVVNGAFSKSLEDIKDGNLNLVSISVFII